ncbi:TetR/AcrR family transcriptional regulator [Gilvimarinus xylanilyticus]|uniref:TetR/AcrR family transcriptional regulator n=1 Tax=Gilvimarinus xylanilyticus TaxID=2944139 RepID=A0A9X2HYR4_9GAMM|nr:TetR/AcrR family transcriptional regulator [Gilvimarinus xylanilyticus]MCP8897788.1 TetR/AcrR family transcriptional regulator [Gilvimarinus xylanilyticus]
MPRSAQYDRETALQAAVDLFWQRGFYATSLKDIEKALDMRPGSLYAAFGNKQQLFDSAIDAYAQRMTIDVNRFIEQEAGVIDGVLAYLRWLLVGDDRTSLTETPACLVVKTLLESTDESDPLRSKSRQLLQGVEKCFAQALEQAKATGELKASVDCERLARLLQTQVMGARSFAQSSPDAEHINNLVDDIALIFAPYRQ